MNPPDSGLTLNDQQTLQDALHELFINPAWLRVEELIRALASGKPVTRGALVAKTIWARLEGATKNEPFTGVVHRAL